MLLSNACSHASHYVQLFRCHAFFLWQSHYAVVGVRILIVTFSCFFLYLLAGESRPMVGFSPGLILESEGRTSCGLSVENVLVKVAFSV
jgi:hypothetical protein